MYSQTYNEYIQRTKQDMYTGKKLKIPKPELYVVYTGNEEVPSEISLSESFFDGLDISIEIKVKVLSNPTWDKKSRNIIEQYITFAKIYDTHYKMCKNRAKALKATIKKCIENNILAKYLKNKKEMELMSMMETLFDEETIMEARIVTAERIKTFEYILNLMKKKGYSFYEALDILVDPNEYWWYESEYKEYLKEQNNNTDTNL